MTSPAPLTTTFPPRMNGAPPTSGGFLGYNKVSRTVEKGKDNDISSNAPLLVGREKIKPQAGNYRQFFRSQLAVGEEKAHLNINENDNVYREYEEEGDIEYKHFDTKRVAPGLVSSFSSVLPATRSKTLDVKRVETQTSFGLQKEKFETLTDYQSWIQREVDPFLVVNNILMI
jgi:hypothetical protein